MGLTSKDDRGDLEVLDEVADRHHAQEWADAHPDPPGHLRALHPLPALGIPLAARRFLVARRGRRPGAPALLSSSPAVVPGGLLQRLPAGLPRALPRLPRRVVSPTPLLPLADHRPGGG